MLNVIHVPSAEFRFGSMSNTEPWGVGCSGTLALRYVNVKVIYFYRGYLLFQELVPDH